MTHETWFLIIWALNIECCNLVLHSNSRLSYAMATSALKIGRSWAWSKLYYLDQALAPLLRALFSPLVLPLSKLFRKSHRKMKWCLPDFSISQSPVCNSLLTFENLLPSNLCLNDVSFASKKIEEWPWLLIEEWMTPFQAVLCFSSWKRRIKILSSALGA